MEKEKKILKITDPPSCDFLQRNIKAEKQAIEEYMRESLRTSDETIRTAIHSIGVQEMEHLELLEGIKRKMGCNFE